MIKILIDVKKEKLRTFSDSFTLKKLKISCNSLLYAVLQIWRNKFTGDNSEQSEA